MMDWWIDESSPGPSELNDEGILAHILTDGDVWIPVRIMSVSQDSVTLFVTGSQTIKGVKVTKDVGATSLELDATMSPVFVQNGTLTVTWTDGMNPL